MICATGVVMPVILPATADNATERTSVLSEDGDSAGYPVRSG
jgi:hypothetical protein